MATIRSRHQVTETPDIERALDLASEEGRAKEAHHRLAAIDATSGKYADVCTDGYLAELRQDWPE